MRKIEMMTGLALCACAAAAAPLASGNVMGVMKVTNTLTYAALPVPFEAAGGGALKLKELVADGLSAGDRLVVCEDGAYKGVKYDGSVWKGETTVIEGGDIVSGDPESAVPPCGRAVWCQRADPSKPVLVMGQVPATYPDVAVSAASGGEAAYTLLYNPKGEAFTLNAAGAISGAGKDDQILVQRGAAHDVYTYDGTAWGYDRLVTSTITRTINGVEKEITVSTKERVTAGDMVVPAGYGFWYVSKGGAAPVVKW